MIYLQILCTGIIPFKKQMSTRDVLDSKASTLHVDKLKHSAHPNRYIGCHVPLRYENLIDPKTGKRIENRRVCANEDCKERTFESCKTCDIHLCFYPCWEQWHTPK